MKIILLILFIVSLTGCGTVLTPKTKVISVNSEIPVEVWLEGKEVVSVGKINVFRVGNRRGGEDYLILKEVGRPENEYRIELERKFNRMTLLNLPIFFGAAGYPIDYLTGATGKLKKTTYEIYDFTDGEI